jgi:hypothetical protein
MSDYEETALEECEEARIRDAQYTDSELAVKLIEAESRILQLEEAIQEFVDGYLKPEMMPGLTELINHLERS